MGWFATREQWFEDQYAHDEELKFEILARRDKRMAAWAADLLGLQGAAVARYIDDFIHFRIGHPGDEALIAKLRRDFDAKGVRVVNFKIRKKMEETLRQGATDSNVGR